MGIDPATANRGPGSSSRFAGSQRRTSSERFRAVIGHFATGVTVITTRHAGEAYGTTASAVSSLSLEPPMVVICMHKTSGTGQAILRSGMFAINILSEDQRSIAEHFASKQRGKMQSADVTTGVLGQPLLSDAIATLECRVTNTVPGGTHMVFLAEVESAIARGGAPLAYFLGEFGRLEMVHDDVTYRTLRGQLLAGERLPGEPLDVPVLATQLDVAAGVIDRALGKLATEGVVERRDSGSFVPRPITWEIVRDVLDSRCAIELGVIEVTVGRVSDRELAQLERTLTTNEATAGARAVSGDNGSRPPEFHEALVSLARRGGLLVAYRSLAFPGIMPLLLQAHEVAAFAGSLHDEHRQILDAYRLADPARARRIVARHNQRLKQAAGAALEETQRARSAARRTSHSDRRAR